MTHLAPSGPQQAAPPPYGSTRSTAYTAACPCCKGDADWFATAASTIGDLSYTTATHRIDCAACLDCPCVVEEIA